MSVDGLDWDNFKALFDEARTLNDEQREIFLDRACGGDHGLRQELVTLLSTLSESTGYFEALAINVLPDQLRKKVKDQFDSSENKAPDPLIGKDVGNYQIEARLGRGGMGVVYKARHKTLGHFAALKFLPIHLSTDPEAKARLKQEARAAYALDHANICTVHDIGETDAGQIYIAMAYYDGETLKEKLRNGPIALRDALNYTKQISEGLARAHSEGIIHLDVKPANVIVTREGVAKLLDFGVARGVDAGPEGSRRMGTVAYMSPEQASGTNIDRRTDLWSVGILLFELVTGQHPLGPLRNDSSAVLKALADDEPFRPTVTIVSVPSSVERIITKCLKKRLDERYQTATSLFADLHRVSRAIRNPAAGTRIFISYQNNIEPDKSVADAIRTALAPEHEVCSTVDGLVGTGWIEQLEADLTGADFVIALLSEGSAKSEMVMGEIELANRLSAEGDNGPVIIPVALDAGVPASYPISAHLSGLRWIEWRGKDGTPALIEEIGRAVTGGMTETGEKGIANRRLSERSLSGPFERASPDDDGPTLYIERKEDAAGIRAIQQEGVTITIKGSRQMGKSSLLGRIAVEARRNGKEVALLDLRLFDGPALLDSDVFFRRFCSRITDELGLENLVESFWERPVSNPHRCTRYLSRHVLPSVSHPVLLAMDNVDRVFDTHFRLDFFGMLRSWHNNRATDPIWTRLDLALVTSTEPYELIETPHLSPFNVGQLISLQDFSKDEMSILNDRHGAPLSNEQVSELAILLGGHPYLVRRALDLVARQGMAFETLIKAASDQDGPFGDHLKYHLFRLHSQPDLFEALREALRTKKCESDAVFWQLSGAGLIKRNGEYVLPRNKLYGDYFMRHLLG